MAGDGTKTVRIEYVVVGIFGAFLGAEFVSSLFTSALPVAVAVPKSFGPQVAEPSKAFTIGGLAMAVIGASVMLGALALLRKAVGPMKPHKRPNPKRY